MKNLFLILCCLCFCGCANLSLDDRFSHTHLGDSLRISKLDIHDGGNVVFEFGKSELERLEAEIGQLSIFDLEVGDCNRCLEDVRQEFHFEFSDGFGIRVEPQAGDINGDYILDLCLPDGGFQGSMTRFVRLNEVLSQNRLDEVKKVISKPSG